MARETQESSKIMAEPDRIRKALLLPAYADPPDSASEAWVYALPDPSHGYSARLDLWLVSSSAEGLHGRLPDSVRNRLVEQLATALVGDYRTKFDEPPNDSQTRRD